MFSLSQGGKGKAAGLSLPRLCSVSSTRQERLGTPACPRAEAAGNRGMAQTTSSVGPMQKSGGTQKAHPTCLPPRRHGFPLAGGAQTSSFEQAVAGPRRKRPRVQIMDHSLPHDGGFRKAQHTHQPPMLLEQKPASHNLCSPGLRHSCSHGPGAKPCASSACSPMDSQPASAPPTSASLWSSSHSCAETQGSSCFSSMLLLRLPR